MNENLLKLLDELKTNENLAADCKKAKTFDELYDIAAKYVSGYTKDEFKEGLRQLNRQLNRTNDELSDDDLEAVAGGSKAGFNEKITKSDTFGGTEIGGIVKDMITLGL